MTLENVCIVNNNGTNDPNQHAEAEIYQQWCLAGFKELF